MLNYWDHLEDTKPNKAMREVKLPEEWSDEMVEKIGKFIAEADAFDEYHVMSLVDKCLQNFRDMKTGQESWNERQRLQALHPTKQIKKNITFDSNNEMQIELVVQK